MIKNILLLLLLSIGISSTAQKLKVVTTQLSKGKLPGNDYIQLVVVGKNHCDEVNGPDQYANISGTVIYDGNLDAQHVKNGVTSWGLGSGKFCLPNINPFKNIYYGSQILIYNDEDKNSSINKQAPAVDLKGNFITHFYIIPQSMLELVDSLKTPPTDSILPSPPQLTYKGYLLSISEQVEATLTKPIDFPYVTTTSDWDVNTFKGNENPLSNVSTIQGWIDNLQISSVQSYGFSVSQNPGLIIFKDTATGKKDTANECPKNITFTRSNANISGVTFTWMYHNYTTGDTTILDTTQAKTVTQYMTNGDAVFLLGSKPSKCVTNDSVYARSYRPTIQPVPIPMRVQITADSLSLPIYDTLGRDTSGNLDSSVVHVAFCKGSSTRFHASPNQSQGSDSYSWIKNGVVVSYDTTYIDSNIAIGKDTLLFTVNSNIPCLVNPLDTIRIIVSGLDSVAIPKITIKGDTSVCSGIKDTFTAVLSPSPLADSSAKYKIVWFTNSSGGTPAYDDPTIYTDTSTAPKIFVDLNTNPGDVISAILLVSKTNSCQYYYRDTLSYDSLLLSANPPLHDTSNILTLGVTTTITPTISLVASQSSLCPDSILQRLGVKDTVLFTAVADTISAKTALYTWFINGVPMKDSSFLTFNPTNDTATFISKGLLKDSDIVSVVMVTSFKCVTTDSATSSIQMNPAIPIFTANLAHDPFCSAGLQNSATLAPDNIQNAGSHPTYKWTLNNTPISDSSVYIYSPIRDKDTVGLRITSSIACAQPKDTTMLLPILVKTALTPTDSISAPTLTTCSNDPNNPNGVPFVINTYPVNGGTNPSYTCYLVGASGPGSDILLANDTIVYLTNTGTTPQVQQVYCTMISSESCVTTGGNPVFSKDTISVTVNPLPVVDPIQGNPTVCVGAQTTLTETTLGGQWNSLSPYYATVDANGTVTGMNQGNATILYLKIDPTTFCTKTQNFQLTINPSDVPFDSLYYKTICAGQSDTISNIIFPQGTFISSDPTIATVTPGVDINGLPIAIVTPVGNGMVVITDSILNDCGTTLRRDTIFVGVPAIQPIQGNNTICTIGGTSQLSVVVKGDTAHIWNTSDPSILTVDANTGLVTAAGSGNATITYSAYNSCAQFSPVTQSFSINVGRPTTTASIYSGTSPICIASSSMPFNSSISGGYWASSDTTIATIDSMSGIASGKALGNTTLYYVVSNACGRDSAAQQSLQVIQGVPIQHMVGDSVVCTLARFQYTNPSAGATSTNWSLTNNDLASIDQSGLLTASTQNGLDTIIYAYTNGCGTKYDSSTVVIGIPVIQQLIAKSPICVNDTITLLSVTRGATLGTLWNSLNENYLHIINSQTGSSVGVGGGLANLQYVATNACGVNLGKTSLTVNALPVIPAIVGRPTLCLKDTLTYTDTTLNGIWSSSNPAAASITSTGFVTALASGNTIVRYAVTSATTKCSNAMTEAVTVNLLPTVSPITGANTVCEGRPINLSNATTTPTSNWSSNNTSIATVTSTGTVLGIQPGSTTIKYLVIDANSCRDSVSAPVTVNAIPSVAPIVGLPNLCTGKTWPFTDATPSGTWSTVFGKATITTDGVVTSLAKGNDTIKYKVVANGCDTTVVFPIGLTTPAVAPIKADTVKIPVGLTIDLKDDSLPGVWSSLSPDIATTVGISPGIGRVTGVKAGSDSIQYTYTDPTGCDAPAYIVITILDQLNDVYIPTAFSPTSSDAANRNFMVLGKDIATLDFKIFSPWGELLFQTTDKNNAGWDGTKNGKFEPSGVYVYLAKITLLDGKSISKKGAVNLIR